MILKTAFIQPKIPLFRFFLTVYFSDNLFDFLYNLEYFIFHFLLLFFSNCYQGNLSQIGEPRTGGLKVNSQVLR